MTKYCVNRRRHKPQQLYGIRTSNQQRGDKSGRYVTKQKLKYMRIKGGSSVSTSYTIAQMVLLMYPIQSRSVQQTMRTSEYRVRHNNPYWNHPKGTGTLWDVRKPQRQRVQYDEIHSAMNKTRGSLHRLLLVTE